MMTAYNKNLRRIQVIAKEKKLILNPDPARVQKVVGLMTENFEAVGEYICPCNQKNKPPIKGRDILCPCPDMMDEVAKDGHCFCRLFFTPEAAKAAEENPL